MSIRRISCKATPCRPSYRVSHAKLFVHPVLGVNEITKTRTDLTTVLVLLFFCHLSSPNKSFVCINTDLGARFRNPRTFSEIERSILRCLARGRKVMCHELEAFLKECNFVRHVFRCNPRNAAAIRATQLFLDMLFSLL